MSSEPREPRSGDVFLRHPVTDHKSLFMVYEDAEGDWRWYAMCNTALHDHGARSTNAYTLEGIWEDWYNNNILEYVYNIYDLGDKYINFNNKQQEDKEDE